MIRELFAVGLGGAAGSIVRYMLSVWLLGGHTLLGFPAGTFTVNAAGSLLSGILLFLHVPVLVCAILAIIGTLGGIASLLLGKSGALPAAVAIGTGLMCVLTFAVENAAK